MKTVYYLEVMLWLQISINSDVLIDYYLKL